MSTQSPVYWQQNRLDPYPNNKSSKAAAEVKLNQKVGIPGNMDRGRSWNLAGARAVSGRTRIGEELIPRIKV